MAFYDKFLNKALDRLGVIRRSELSKFLPTSALFSGETYPGAEWNIYANWSEYELQKLAVTNPWVYSSINIIGKEIALGTIGVERRSKKDGEKWIAEVNHEFERIVEGKPNPYMGQFYTWLYQVMWLCIQGEAYWMLVPNRMGELTHMYPLPANRIIPIPDSTGQRLFAGFAYTPVDGVPAQILPPEQVCFHRFPNLFDYHRGMSPISAYLISLQLDTEARKFDLEDYQNGLTLKHLVSMRPETSERDRQVVRGDLNQSRTEGDRFLLIRGGQLDVKSLDNRRGENGIIRKLTREECNYIFGIPEGVRDANATEANATVGQNMFRSTTLWPLMVMLAEDMTAQIIHRFYSEELRAAFEDIRPENVELKLKEKDSKRKTQTYDEARAEEGLAPHPDADIGQAPFPIAGAVYLQKFKQQSVSKQLPAGMEPEGEEGQPGEGEAAKAIGDDVPGEIKEYEAELSRLIEMGSNGTIDRTEFEERVGDLTEAVLLAVFLLGSGKSEAELTEEDRAALNERIAADLASVENLANDVYEGRFKPLDEGGVGHSVAARVALWAGFAVGVWQLAQLFRADDPWLRWDMGIAKHCPSCLDLSGQIKRAGEWKALGLHPRSHNLICQGFCHCRFTEVRQKAIYEPVLNGKGYHAEPVV